VVDVTTAGVDGVVVIDTTGLDQSAHLLLSTTGVVVEVMSTGVDGVQSAQDAVVDVMTTGMEGWVVTMGMLEVVQGVSPPP
jgi:hypothetical protein